MKRCPSCRTEYADDAQFCTRDGTRLIEQTAFTRAATSAAEVRSTAAPLRSQGDAAMPGAGLVGQVLDGRYRIERKVGEGGMSFVYLATDISTQERCAIKVLSAALSQDANAMARLKREASFGMRLAHPNVCHIMRLGETVTGLMYVVMPFIEGELLTDRTNRLGNIPLDEAVVLVHDMAAGLQVAHALKIVHRDLKPENIMVCKRADGSEYAVVMDFGLAKERRAGAELQKLTATGIIMGTPEFMSPEQLRGKPLDPRTDIYSLSLLTYEMLTSRLPFQGRTQQEMMIARLRSEPTPLRRMRPDLDFPEAVEQVLNRGMARSPDERYQEVVEFADALARASGSASGLVGKLSGR